MSAEFTLLGAFLVGIAGSVHCVGMCGGVVAAFSFARKDQLHQGRYTLVYNLGRLLSYALAGAVTGAIGSIARTQLTHGLSILSLLSAVFMLLLALYIGQWWQGLVYLEKLGQKLWRYLQPLSKRLVPIHNLGQALAYGMIWGWLPCGLVYSALTWSLASGSALQGALLMACFGAGTLPAVLGLGFSATTLKPLLQHPLFRQAAAIALFTLGAMLLVTQLRVWFVDFQASTVVIK